MGCFALLGKPQDGAMRIIKRTRQDYAARLYAFS